MKNIIIIWNKIEENYLNKLLKSILDQISLTPNDCRYHFFLDPYDFFNEDTEIIKEKLDILKNADSIIILAELTWNNKLRPEFYGLEIVEKLRISEVKSPLIICSFMSIKILSKNKKPKFQLLNTPGVFYYQLPAGEIQVDENKPFKALSNNLLQDIDYYIFTRSGKLDEIFHDLKNHLGYETIEVNDDEYNLLKPLVDEAFQDIQGILSSSDIRILEYIKKSYFEEIKGKRCSPSEVLYKYKPDISRLIKTDDDKIPVKQLSIPWSVLYVEDNPENLNLIRDNFTALGIVCFTATTGIEAIEILHKDFKGDLEHNEKSLPSNSITVLITDWRLKSTDNKWNYLQGYDLIDKIFIEFQNMLSFFVLTSKKGGIIKKVQELSKTQVHWYAKDDVMDSAGSFNLFSERVVEEGNKIYDELICRPKNSSWYNPQIFGETVFKEGLKEYYRAYRLSADYNKYEKDVSVAAMDLIENAIEMKEKYEENEIDPEPIDLPFEFTQKLTGPPILENDQINKIMIKAFMNKLIARRVAIGLWLTSRISSFIPLNAEDNFEEFEKFNWEINEILFFLKTGTFIEESAISVLEKKEKINLNNFDCEIWLENNYKQFFNVHLALSKKINTVIPNYLLIEEINWINEYLGIPISRSKIDFYKEIGFYLQGIFNEIKGYMGENLFKKIEDKYTEAFGKPYKVVKNSKEAENYLKIIKKIFEEVSHIDWKPVKIYIRTNLDKLLSNDNYTEIAKEERLLNKMERLT